MASGEGVSRRGRVSVRFTDAVPPWLDEYLALTKKTRIISGTKGSLQNKKGLLFVSLGQGGGEDLKNP